MYYRAETVKLCYIIYGHEMMQQFLRYFFCTHFYGISYVKNAYLKYVYKKGHKTITEINIENMATSFDYNIL